MYRVTIKRREPSSRSPFAYTQEEYQFAARQSADGLTWRFYTW